ncbi:MAG: hypothetical protein MUF42_17245 [Cytophagaceae bacterium]|jgi:hypothetical protein|nr:hypothetical protein [Cytophagaceae bacterium]
MVQRIDSEYLTTWLEDDIVYGVCKRNLEINLEIAKLMVADRILVSNSKTRPALIDISGVVAIDTKARKFLASEQSIRYINAGAIIVNGIIPKYLGNIYLTLDRPPIPAKIFNNKDAALAWLEKYKTF